MTLSLPGGTCAAIVTPRKSDGSLDINGFAAVVRFVAASGIRSVALNGATGEFCLTSTEELTLMLQCVREAAGTPLTILCGVGAADIGRSRQLAAVAYEARVDALLVPAPIFFRYSQDDLDAFVRAFAAETELPIVLYNLPQFSSGFTKETVAGLIRDVPNVIGIKDSSGSLDILRHLTEVELPCARFVGNDSVIAQALAEGVCDGAISGVACAMPEVVQGLMTASRMQNQDQLQLMQASLEQIIEAIERFPAPWGIKWLLEARGITRATFAQPLSTHRRHQAEDLHAWFTSWLPTLDSSMATY